MNVAETAPASACADRQENFLAKGVLEFLELQSRLAFVAQHLEHGRSAFLGNLDSAAFDVHNVHLQRLHQKIPVIAAIRTGQRHT